MAELEGRAVVRPKLAVSAAVFDAAGRVLLIQRGKAPALGLWSLPGGHVEWGERLDEACRRELREETGLEIVVGPLVELVERIGPDYHFVIVDYLARCAGPEEANEPRSGGDAADARWVALDELGAFALTDGLEPILRKAAAMNTDPW